MSRKNNIKKMLNSDKHERYRSYKRKKTWMYATITGIASVLGGGSIAVPMIKADTTSTGDSQAKEIDSTSQLLVNQSSTTIPASTSSRTVHIDGADYGKYFVQNGTATIAGDTSTLTQDIGNQVGNTLLNTKIDMDQSFTLQGLVNLGDKSKSQGGADGIGFVFQPGDTNVIGTAGNGMGIAGVQGAFGFKLDTYYNSDTKPAYNPDPSRFATSDNGKSASFGAFVDGTSGVANTIDSTDSPAKQISQPSNNEFKTITVSYDGNTKAMTVSYDGQSWTMDISSLLGNNTAMSFGILGSTGSFHNTQQFRLTSFDYTVAQGKVTAHYVDDTGKTINPDVTQQGDIGDPWSTEQKDIPGYTFKETQGTPTGNYTANDQEVTYVYTFGDSASDSDSQSDSLSDSTSDSTSDSVSDSNSLSDSDSDSMSDSTSDSVSDSNSLSDSDSDST
ncbi:lectin-like domain-containing protein, partial [Lactococcus lactis]